MQTTTPEKRSIENNLTRVDKVFQKLVTLGAFFSMVVLAAIGGFLLYRGFEIFKDFGKILKLLIFFCAVGQIFIVVNGQY